MRLSEQKEGEPTVLCSDAIEAVCGFRSSLVGINVLLCEDHPVNQSILTCLLEGMGVTLQVANTGKEGYEAWVASTPFEFDAVLMDIHMPDMNGYETARAIRTSAHLRARSVPILAITSKTLAEEVQKSLDAGMNAHLTKPIDPRCLHDALMEWTGRQ